MWAQLMSWRAKPGADVSGLRPALQAAEQPDSGLLRTLLLQDQNDPDQYYTLVLFESEERARAREADPRRAEGLAGVRSLLGGILAGSMEFHDLVVVEDFTP